MSRVSCLAVLLILVVLALKVVGAVEISWWWALAVPPVFYAGLLVDGYREFRRRQEDENR